MNILKKLNSKLVNYQMKKGHTFLFGKPYLLINESKDFGNIFTTPFYKLWNNKNYREAGKYNITRKNTNFLNRCTTCKHIGTANHRCK